MKLPNADLAVIDIRKIRDYVLNPNDPRGRHKARVFLSALGFSQSDSDELITEILSLSKTRMRQWGNMTSMANVIQLIVELRQGRVKRPLERGGLLNAPNRSRE